jgi:hypothetical protein
MEKGLVLEATPRPQGHELSSPPHTITSTSITSVFASLVILQAFG